jgi:hypothetical protein
MIFGLIVLPWYGNVLGESVVLWLPAAYPLHIQEAIKYADISVNWVWRNIWHVDELCASVTEYFDVIRGGQLHEPREPHFRRQLLPIAISLSS